MHYTIDILEEMKRVLGKPEHKLCFEQLRGFAYASVAKMEVVVNGRRLVRYMYRKVFTDAKRIDQEKRIGDVLNKYRKFIPNILYTFERKGMELYTEYIDGPTLQEVAETAPFEELLAYLQQIFLVLDYLHAQVGFNHNDLHSSNVVLNPLKNPAIFHIGLTQVSVPIICVLFDFERSLTNCKEPINYDLVTMLVTVLGRRFPDRCNEIMTFFGFPKWVFKDDYESIWDLNRDYKSSSGRTRETLKKYPQPEMGAFLDYCRDYYGVDIRARDTRHGLVG